MDIDLLSEMIKELLLDNDEVTLPGLGMFVTGIVPATFSDKGYTILPPYRKLSFRQRTGTDGALVRFYAESNGTEPEMAEQILLDFAESIKRALKTRKSVTFPGLGRLRATKENAWFFIPDEDLDIYPYGIGLEPVSLKTHEETPEELSAAVAGLRSLVETPAEEPERGTASPQAAEAQPEPETEQPEPAETQPEPETAETRTTPAAAEAQAEPAPAEPAQEPEPVEPAPVEPAPADPEQEAPVTETDPIRPATDGKEWVPLSTLNKKRSPWKRIGIAAGILAAAAVLLLVAFLVTARLAPDFTDRLLYTPEELEIIHYQL